MPKLDMKAVVGPTLAHQSHTLVEVHWKLMLLHYVGTEHVDAVFRLREELSSRWLLVSGLAARHTVIGWHSQCAAANMPIDHGVLSMASTHFLFMEAQPMGRKRVMLVFAAKDRLMGMC